MKHSNLRVVLVVAALATPIPPARCEVTKAKQNCADGAVTITKLTISVDPSLYVRYEGSRREVQADFPSGFVPAVGSGLAFRGKAADGALEFWALTDRGPNGDGPTAPREPTSNETGAGKIFPAPSFAPSIGLLTVGRGAAGLKTLKPLTLADGTRISGRPIASGIGANGEVPLTEELRVDPVKPYDANGLDAESLAFDAKHGIFWIADEYGPFIVKVDAASEKILKKYQPGEQKGDLPAILAKRRANRGIEGLALDPATGRLHGFLQSPLDDGKAVYRVTGQSESVRNFARFARWIEFDPASETSRLYAFPVDGAQYKDGRTGHCKLGDVATVGRGKFVVIEQGAGPDGKVFNWLVLVEIPSDATEITTVGSDLEKSSLTGSPVGGADWSMIVPLKKTKLFDLNAAGWRVEKAEGLAVVGERTLAVVNDNDFGLRTRLFDAQGQTLDGNIEDCAVDGTGAFLAACAGERARIVPAVEAERQTTFWLLEFPKKLAHYSASR